MEHEKIERINELARKAKSVGLTAEEIVERDALRKEYLKGFRENMEAVLAGVVIQEKDGTKHALTRKENN